VPLKAVYVRRERIAIHGGGIQRDETAHVTHEASAVTLACW
jgi:hypothetical protein